MLLFPKFDLSFDFDRRQLQIEEVLKSWISETSCLGEVQMSSQPRGAEEQRQSCFEPRSRGFGVHRPELSAFTFRYSRSSMKPLRSMAITASSIS